MNITTEFVRDLAAALTAAGMQVEGIENYDLPRTCQIWVTVTPGRLSEICLSAEKIDFFDTQEDAFLATWPLLPVPEIVLRVQLLLGVGSSGDIVCPKCGSQDLQLDGTRSVRVIEDWTAGRRWNYEYPAAPSSKWGSLSAHCLSCDHEWEILPDPGAEMTYTGEDLPSTGELSPHAGEDLTHAGEPKELTDD